MYLGNNIGWYYLIMTLLLSLVILYVNAVPSFNPMTAAMAPSPAPNLELDIEEDGWKKFKDPHKINALDNSDFSLSNSSDKLIQCCLGFNQT